MGNNMSCKCSHSSTEKILVIREDGSFLKFKKGVHAKEIMEVHEGMCLVRCSSGRAVLQEKTELETSRLYFLLPKSSAKSREAYEKMLLICESKGMVERQPSRREVKGERVHLNSSISSITSIRCSEIMKRCDSWAPELKPIPEITSPADVARS